jgi:hypothetical protein
MSNTCAEPIELLIQSDNDGTTGFSMFGPGRELKSSQVRCRGNYATLCVIAARANRHLVERVTAGKIV